MASVSKVLKARHRDVAMMAYETGITPLEFMLEVMRDDGNDLLIRMDAAKAAAPYVHPKLASVEMKHSGGVTVATLTDAELLEMLSEQGLIAGQVGEETKLIDARDPIELVGK